MAKKLKRNVVAPTQVIDDPSDRVGRCAIRVSFQGARGRTNDQGEVERGFFSPEIQSDAAADLYARLGIDYDAEISWDLKDIDRRASKDGSIEDREGLQQHLADARNKKFTDIAFYKVSRMARSPMDGLQAVLDFIEAGVRVHFLKDSLPDVNTPLGQTFLLWFLNQARAESDNTSQFVSDAIALKWKKGIPHGVTHGWLEKINGVYTIHEQGWRSYRRLVALGLEGHSYSEISRRLNTEGLPTRRGKLWTAAQVSGILRVENIPKLLGIAVCDDLLNKEGRPIRIPEAWPALISEEEAAQLRLLAPIKTASVPRVKNQRTNYARNRFLLSGIVRCSICGESLNAGHGHTRGGEYDTYCCKQGANGHPLHEAALHDEAGAWVKGNKTIQVDKENLDEAVLRVVTHGMDVPEVEKVMGERKPKARAKIRTTGDIEQDAMKLLKQKDELPDWLFAKRMQELDAERSKVMSEMADQQSQRNLDLAMRREQDEQVAKKLLIRALVASATFPHSLQGKRRVYRAVRVVMKTGEAYLAPIHKEDFTGVRAIVRDDEAI